MSEHDEEQSALERLVEDGAVPIPGEERPPLGDAAPEEDDE